MSTTGYRVGRPRIAFPQMWAICWSWRETRWSVPSSSGFFAARRPLSTSDASWSLPVSGVGETPRVELTGHVVTTACRAAVKWDAVGGAPMFVSVNIGLDELREPVVVDLVRTTLAETGMGPGDVVARGSG